MKFIFVLLSITFLYTCTSDKIEVDLIVFNANIITMDEQNPKGQAIAVKDGRIVYVGDSNGIKQYEAADNNVIDLKGKSVIPGIIESHAHFLSLGKSLMKLRLEKAENWSDIVLMVQKAVANSKPGQWITGRGWHQDKWDKLPENAIKGYPVHTALSSISPENPVMLTHASGHAVFANAQAMQLAGVNATTLDPQGGKIIRFEDGSPSGIFIENAESLVKDAFNLDEKKKELAERQNEKTMAIDKVGQLCLSYGITSFHDAGATFEDVDLFKQLADKQKLPLRLWVMLYETNDSLTKHIDSYKLKDYGNGFLSVGGIKRWMDGALGSRGAWLLNAYSDMPSSCGLNTIPLDEFRKTAEIAFKHGFQLCTHAIGDKQTERH